MITPTAFAADNPETIVLQPGPEGKDTFVDSYNPTQNSGTQTLLNVANYSFLNMVDHSLLEFDVSGIPSGSTIVSAQLYVYCTFNGGITGGGMGIDHIYRVTSPWEEELATWKNHPSADTTNEFGSIWFTQQNQWGSTDITSLVNGWVNGTNPNYGLQLRTDTPYGILRLASSDHDDVTLRPKLVITYSTSGS